MSIQATSPWSNAGAAAAAASTAGAGAAAGSGSTATVSDGAGDTWAWAWALLEKAPTASALTSIIRHTAWNRACHPVNKEVFIVGSEWG
ncbi:hypothetical protein D3C71_1485030 [compost metagenome]